MANKQGKMQNLINYRLRVTLNDGRQMTGQMLAFDKVRSHIPIPLAPRLYRSLTSSPAAHEPRPGRHRRIPQNPPSATCQTHRPCCPRLSIRLHRPDRRETHPRPRHPPWHEHRLLLRRRPSSLRSLSSPRNIRPQRTDYAPSRPGHLKTSRKRSTDGIGRTSSGRGRTTTTRRRVWVPRGPTRRFGERWTAARIRGRATARVWRATTGFPGSGRAPAWIWGQMMAVEGSRVRENDEGCISLEAARGSGAQKGAQKIRAYDPQEAAVISNTSFPRQYGRDGPKIC